jgi:hypothetical protein
MMVSELGSGLVWELAITACHTRVKNILQAQWIGEERRTQSWAPGEDPLRAWQILPRAGDAP